MLQSQKAAGIGPSDVILVDQVATFWPIDDVLIM